MSFFKYNYNVFNIYFSNIIMQLYVYLVFYAFHSVNFATTYHLCIIHNSYLILGFGAENICLHICLHILVRPFNFISSSHQSFF